MAGDKNMRQISISLTYSVPGWNYCNNDRRTELLCRFCEKTKTGHVCRLYDADLKSDGAMVDKIPACCRATVGYATGVEHTDYHVDPKTIMKETIKIYNKTLSELLGQGYPKPLAEKLATQFVLGEK